jgi:very-short-patch-repair endonuclease
MGRRRKAGIESIIAPSAGLFMLGWFVVPGFSKALIVILLIGLGLTAIFLATKWWVNTQKNEDAFTSSLTMSKREEPPELPTQEQPRYKIAKSLITEGEKIFYETLKRAIPEATIHSKVRVSDVLIHASKNLGDFRRISQYHFDWVVCDPATSEPLLAIELDDSSHDSWRAKRNDENKNEAAEEAGFTILRFPWARSYDEDSIRLRIADVINKLADQKDPPEKPRQVNTANVAAQVNAEIEASIRSRRTSQ